MTIPFPHTGVIVDVQPRTESQHRQAGILRILVIGYVLLLPYLFEFERGLNFAPSDCFMLLVLLLSAGQLKYSKPAWTIWHLLIPLTFAVGSFVAAWRFGELFRYEFLNKDAGLLLPFVSYAAITSTITEWEDLRRLLRVFTLSVVFENVLAIAGFLLAYFFGVATPFARYGGLRLSGMLLDPNAYGGLLIVALMISEGGSWGEAPLFRKPMLWFARLTLAMGILFTFSRSAWIGLGVALLVLFAIRPKVGLRFVLAGLMSAPLVVLFLGPRFVPIFEVMASRPKQVQGRFDLIHAALQAFKQHPFLGGGLGSFRLSEGEVAHNSAMWFLADFGIVGLAVLLGFVGWFFAKAWFAYRFAPERERPLVLSLLLAHTAMLGLAMGIEAFYQRHWWVIFALIASSYALTLRSAGNARRTSEVLPYVHS
jgi:putative inorganic carbon (HCO3(-)) transporter